MKHLIIALLIGLSACGKKDENPAPPPPNDPATSFQGQVGNVQFFGTNSKDPVGDKIKAEAAIKLTPKQK